MPSIATRAIKYSLILPPTCQSFAFDLAPPPPPADLAPTLPVHLSLSRSSGSSLILTPRVNHVMGYRPDRWAATLHSQHGRVSRPGDRNSRIYQIVTGPYNIQIQIPPLARRRVRHGYCWLRFARTCPGKRDGQFLCCVSFSVHD